MTSNPTLHDLRKANEMHAIYAAFFDLEDKVIVKVGRSAMPYRRIVEVASGCPFEISAAAFCHVGSLSKAQSIESYLQHDLAPYRTRGEWFMFPAKEGSIFSRAMISAHGKATGKPLKWAVVDTDAIQQEMLSAFKAWHGGRGTKLSRAS